MTIKTERRLSQLLPCFIVYQLYAHSYGQFLQQSFSVVFKCLLCATATLGSGCFLWVVSGFFLLIVLSGCRQSCQSGDSVCLETIFSFPGLGSVT